MKNTIEKRIEKLEYSLSQLALQIKSDLQHLEKAITNLKSEKKSDKEQKLSKSRITHSKKGEFDSKDREQAEFEESNEQWWKIAAKMGTIGKDIIYPNIDRIIQKQFDLQSESIIGQTTRILPDGQSKDFDTIVLTPGKLFLNFTMTTLSNEYVKEFINDIATVREYFPEYKSRKIIGILAALNIPQNALKYAERKGFMVLGVGDEIMECKNSENFKPKEW